MSECTHNCSSCGESCADRQGGSPFQIKPLHEGCHVRKVYGVVSGKGGVGKSMVTSQLAVTMQRRGHRTAILDADVTGPSIPKCFGHPRPGRWLRGCHPPGADGDRHPADERKPAAGARD